MYSARRMFLMLLVTSYIVSNPLHVAGKELNDTEELANNKEVAAQLALVYFDKLNQAQTELGQEPSVHSKEILAISAGALNTRLMKWFDYKNKQNKTPANSPAMYQTLAIATSKLGILAQYLGQKEVAGCHFKEFNNLIAIVDGKEGELANCRLAVYGNAEVKAMQLLAKDKDKRLETIINKWVNSNIDYSIEAACAVGYCM